MKLNLRIKLYPLINGTSLKAGIEGSGSSTRSESIPSIGTATGGGGGNLLANSELHNSIMWSFIGPMGELDQTKEESRIEWVLRESR